MLNLGSYNYLGFADDWGSTCRAGVMPVLDSLPVGCSINRRDYGENKGLYTTVLYRPAFYEETRKQAQPDFSYL